MFESLQSILNICETKQKPFWEVVLEDDMEERMVTREDSLQKMKLTWDAMLNAAQNYDKNLHSQSGLVGGDGGKMEDYLQKGNSLSGEFVIKVMAGALQMGESNACMKRIVAAPTAGACGVLPAVLVPYFYEQDRKSVV